MEIKDCGGFVTGNERAGRIGRAGKRVDSKNFQSLDDAVKLSISWRRKMPSYQIELLSK